MDASSVCCLSFFVSFVDFFEVEGFGGAGSEPGSGIFLDLAVRTSGTSLAVEGTVEEVGRFGWPEESFSGTFLDFFFVRSSVPVSGTCLALAVSTGGAVEVVSAPFLRFFFGGSSPGRSPSLEAPRGAERAVEMDSVSIGAVLLFRLLRCGFARPSPAAFELTLDSVGAEEIGFAVASAATFLFFCGGLLPPASASKGTGPEFCETTDGPAGAYWA